MNRPHVFLYDEIHIYLRDYYDWYKNENTGFNYQKFSEQLGFKSKSFVHAFFSGKRKIPTSSLEAMSDLFAWDYLEFQYIQLLIDYHYSVKPIDQHQILLKMAGVLKDAPEPKKINYLEYEYFSTWYIPVIFEWISERGFEGDFDSLSRLIFPQVTNRQTRHAVRVLKSLDYIDENYQPLKKRINSGNEIKNIAVTQFQCEMLHNAEKAIHQIDLNNRDISTVTFTLDPQKISILKNKINAFRTDIVQWINDHQEGDVDVFQLNLQMFPSTISEKKND